MDKRFTYSQYVKSELCKNSAHNMIHQAMCPDLGKKKERMKPDLTISVLKKEAASFATAECTHSEPSIFGVTDGKAIGTYLEHKFRSQLALKHTFDMGNSASGIDFLGLNVDMKVTKTTQPQSSCPYKTARQKIYGLGYGVLVFVYDKIDDQVHKTGRLDILHTIFVDQNRTADFQMTRGILDILKHDGNIDDLLGFFADKNLPVDDIEALSIAEAVLENPPNQGYLTISNALQWRLQYGRVITEAGTVNGIDRVK